MEGMIGEVRMFGGNFAPRAWALCDGQLLPISQNTALYSILGTIYGGDGRTTFALPDVRGRCVISPGNGPGLSSRREGQKGGVENHTMLQSEMPSHSHTAVFRTSSSADNSSPTGGAFAPPTGRTTGSPPVQVNVSMYSSSSNVSMASDMVTLGNTGGQQSIYGMMPYQVVNYIICLQGVFPSRS